MNKDFAAAMRRAMLCTRASDVTEATRVIQNALAGRAARPADGAASKDIGAPRPKQRPALRLIEADAAIVAPSGEPHAPSPAPQADETAGGSRQSPSRLRKPLGEVLQVLRQGRLSIGAFGSLHGMNQPAMRPRIAPPPMADGAQFLTRSFACAAGMRSYKLYIPASAPDRPRGLVVMLHGCKQNPDDFAAGTNMNAVAEAHGLMVAYPGQTGADNAASCWNWFNPADQMRDAGEPAILAGLTREIVSEYGIDRSQVFVAGLSAGGAMAAVMGASYPDLYAAVGIHSGLAYRSANDVVSAFAAMRGDAGLPSPAQPSARAGTQPHPRTFVFHGSADQTVHPVNADRIVAQASRHIPAGGGQQNGKHAAGGRSYKRTVMAGADGVAAMEYWLVDGAGHAWSGGHASGSYTDAAGPDASAEMMRFFLNQPNTVGAS